MDTTTFLARLAEQDLYRGQIVHIERLPEREAVWQELADDLPEALTGMLGGLGIDKFYSHQAAAIDLVRQGKNVVVVTGTASGKTLCYTVPTVEALLADSSATMLYIYPTKALAQDQLRGLNAFQEDKSGFQFLAGTYDGDTPQNLRRKIRDGGSIILTNPDMLHQGILPQHSRWNRFFSHLRYVVIDEVHAYRGVFGSHLANVMRRLMRICRHYGAAPQFICSSATIANPQEHAEKITGHPMELIDNDGSPRGPKQFVLWNPPPLQTAASGGSTGWRVGGDRRSPVYEAVKLLAALVKEGVQTIAFVRTRLAAELVFKDCRDLLRPISNKLASSVQAYRGGYLPEERREIERKLANREILGVGLSTGGLLGQHIGAGRDHRRVGGEAGTVKFQALINLFGDLRAGDQGLDGPSRLDHAATAGDGIDLVLGPGRRLEHHVKAIRDTRIGGAGSALYLASTVNPAQPFEAKGRDPCRALDAVGDDLDQQAMTDQHLLSQRA